MPTIELMDIKHLAYSSNEMKNTAAGMRIMEHIGIF